MIRIVESSNRRAVRALLSPARTRDAATERRVAEIVSAVRRDGDRALTRYARELDGLSGAIEVSRDEMRRAAREVPASVRAAIRTAARHIRTVARRQVPRGWRARVTAGVTVEQRVVPLDRVGCYVPAGRYPLPSSLLMTAIPAAAAGVEEVVAVCPRPAPVVMAAALEAGVSRLFRVGGAHAVAALAYGTDTIPRVDKIVGPGNRYVAAAKALVAADCGIDFYAGPTEIVIVAARGPASWIAADLIAQAEHDPDARAVFITPSRKLAEQVVAEVAAQLPETGPARAALKSHGGVIVTKTAAEAVALANTAAPEHLVVDDERMAKQVRCTGSLFVGAWTAQVAGDYAIGSNHVLPTAGAARVRGGLSAADFVRQITVQRLTAAGLRRIGPTVIDLATAEGLSAHAASVAIRMKGTRS
ncbi:MAG TPA: histidinol dehydrogenase [Vicinamibacterales bacterium]|jgi:histidinol dehydrogenase|nr:histidinol dehydrogenase [Vicinamibacterales bacterium]